MGPETAGRGWWGGEGECRVLSEELAEKVETESDTEGEKNKSLGESMT